MINNRNNAIQWDSILSSLLKSWNWIPVNFFCHHKITKLNSRKLIFFAMAKSSSHDKVIISPWSPTYNMIIIHYTIEKIISNLLAFCFVKSVAYNHYHCVKSVRIRSYSGPDFPAFGLKTDQNNSKYGHFKRSVFFSIILLLCYTCFRPLFLSHYKVCNQDCAWKIFLSSPTIWITENEFSTPMVLIFTSILYYSCLINSKLRIPWRTKQCRTKLSVDFFFWTKFSSPRKTSSLFFGGKFYPTENFVRFWNFKLVHTLIRWCKWQVKCWNHRM